MKVQILHNDNGHRVVISKAGRKYISCVSIDFPVRVIKINKSDARYLRDIDYPLKKAVRRIRSFGNQHGITKGALTILKEAQ